MNLRVMLLVGVLVSLFFTQDTYLPVLTAQTTTTVTKTVQNPDGTYTIIEYPAKKEVVVRLQPSALLPEATGLAKVLRDDAGTLVNISVAMAGPKTDMLEKKGVKYRGWQISNNEFKTCVDQVIAIEGGVVRKTNETCKGTIISQADPPELNVYAVDDRGDVTALGRIAINNGVGTQTFTTPLSRFMLVLSPQDKLSSYDPATTVTFRSSVPEGFAVVPVRSLPGGEKVAAVTTPATGISYTVPMLNIPAYKKGDDTKIKVDFSGALSGTRANVFITPRRDGPTEVRVRFHDLKDAPAGNRFILWAVSPDNRFVNLGQIVSVGGIQEAEIKAETTLPEFGLLVTMEVLSLTPIETPTGPPVATFHVVP